MTPGELSSEKMTWQTPGYFLDLVRAVGPIAFDPCAPAKGNPTGADVLMRQGAPGESCGLSIDWSGGVAPPEDLADDPGLIFVNPPYGPHLSGLVDPGYVHKRKNKKTSQIEITGYGRGWAQKIIRETDHTRIALVPARPDAEWWVRMLRACDACLLWRSKEHGARLKFVDPDTGETVPGNTSPSTVFLFLADDCRDLDAQDVLRRFQKSFSPHGTRIEALT